MKKLIAFSLIMFFLGMSLAIYFLCQVYTISKLGQIIAGLFYVGITVFLVRTYNYYLEVDAELSKRIKDH